MKEDPVNEKQIAACHVDNLQANYVDILEKVDMNQN